MQGFAIALFEYSLRKTQFAPRVIQSWAFRLRPDVERLFAGNSRVTAACCETFPNVSFGHSFADLPREKEGHVNVDTLAGQLLEGRDAPVCACFISYVVIRHMLRKRA